jgi:hypothetical protein
VNRGRVIAVLLTAVVTIGLVSTTLGRAIYAGHTPGLGSFAAIHFAGYLFFLLMPVEALVPIYQAEGHPGATLIMIALATAFAAQVIDYSIGRAVSDRVIDDLIGEKRYERFKAKIEKWGGWAILLSPTVVAEYASRLRHDSLQPEEGFCVQPAGPYRQIPRDRLSIRHRRLVAGARRVIEAQRDWL